MSIITLKLHQRFQPWKVASTDRIRPVLCLACIDPTGFVVATDTHCLVACPFETDSAEPLPAKIGLPAIFWAEARRHRSSKAKPTQIALDLDAKTASFETVYGAMVTQPFLPEGETYPNWRRAVPTGKESFDGTGQDGDGLFSFDHRLLEKIVDAIGFTEKQRVTFRISEALRPTLITVQDGSCDAAIGVLMPMVASDSGRIFFAKAEAELQFAQAGAE